MKNNILAFYPYFYVKDLVGWGAFAIFISIWLFYAPNVLGHPDNYMPANPMSTPAHIVPEWYFLPIYAVLRSIPNKLGGVAAIGLVFVSLLALPFLNISAVRSSSYRLIHQRMFCCLLFDCLLLGWIGCQPVEAPYVIIGQMASAVFFIYFIIMFILSKLEKVFLHFDSKTFFPWAVSLNEISWSCIYIFTGGFFVWFVMGEIGMIFCVGEGEIILSTKALKQQFLQIHPNDSRSYLFEGWKDLERLARGCQKGVLPNSAFAYEMLQQLSSVQLNSLLNSISVGVEPMFAGGAPAVEEWRRLCGDIRGSTENLLQVFRDITPGINLLTGGTLPPTMSLAESLSVLLQIKLPSSDQAYFSSQILQQVHPLLRAYGKLFTVLPLSPDLFFLEQLAAASTSGVFSELVGGNVEGMRLEDAFELCFEDKAAIDAIHAKVKLAFKIAACIQFVQEHTLNKKRRRS